MYRQKRFDRENPDKEIEKKILEIRDNHKDYGYRRMFGELRNQGYCINKKKVQRIMKTSVYKLHPLLVKAVNTTLTKVKLEPLHRIE